MRTSVLRRQNTVAQFIATRPILALCEGSERRGGTRVPQRWWEQKGIDRKLERERRENAETEGTTTDTAGAETTAPAAAEAPTAESDTGLVGGYIAVTQQVLLFGAESWVLTGKMEAALDAFQGRVARRLTGRTPRRGRDGKWFCLPLAGATQAPGIVRVRTSVLRR